MVNVIVDDIPVSVPSNSTVLQACDSVGIDVPRFCFHERLLIAGNCRMCLVEIEKSPKPVASCTLPVMEGMKVFTRTPLVKKAQESVLEFLLLNHPLDCPICDQGGECDIQDQAMLFGSDSGRFYEYKRGVEDKNCGPLVKTIMTRCIHCTRCVRFATEIAGISDLGTTGRGRKTEIGTYVQKLIRSELSGNIIDLCPVGALTSKPYAFTARTWELKSTESIDITDGLGSNIIINTKGNEVLRILPRFNESLNEEWITDKARFSYDGLKKQRLLNPFIRNSEGFLVKETWENSFKILSDQIKGEKNIGSIVGKNVDLETLCLIKSLLNLQGSSDLFSELKINNTNTDLSSTFKLNNHLASLEKSDLCVLVNVNPRLEASLLNTRLRKRVISNNMEVAYIGEALDLTYKAKNLGFSKKSLVSLLEGRHPFCSKIQKSKNPIFIFGNNSFNLNLKTISNLLIKNVNKSIENLSVFNFLNTNIGTTGTLDLGLKPLNLNQIVTKKVVFLVNTHNFDFSSISDDCFIVYIGSHGNIDASFADLILPSVAYTEKRSSYLNIEGRFQSTFKSLAGPGDSREDWKILGAFLCYLGYELPFNSSKDLHSFYSDYLIQNFSINNSVNIDTTTEPFSFVQNSVSNIGIKDFYLTDIISETSRVMQECSQSRSKVNFN